MDKASNTVKYSIVIPTYNHLEDCLRPCINSIIHNTNLDDVEIIVVANGCTDGTADFVKSLGHKFVLVEHPEACGFSKPVNMGIERAKGEFVIILNNDVIFTRNIWLPKLSAEFADEKIGIVGPVRSSIWLDSQHDFMFLAFSCVMIRKTVFDAVGMLNESLYAFAEDIDFCCRADLSGFLLKSCSLISSMHHRGAQTFYDNKQRAELIDRNINYIYLTYLQTNITKSFRDNQYIDCLLDEVHSNSIDSTYNYHVNKLGQHGEIHADIDFRTSVVISKSGFKNGLFVGYDKVNQINSITDKVQNTTKSYIEEWIRSHGVAMTIEGASHGGYYAQQVPSELAGFLHDLKDKQITNYLEIGVSDGGFTRYLCDFVNIRNVYQVDLGSPDTINPYEYTYRQNLRNYRNTGNIYIRRADSCEPATKKWLENQKVKFDLIFIDGDHSYEGVKKDFELAKQFIAPNGIIAFHDHVIKESVGKFIDEIKQKQNCDFVFVAEYLGHDVKFGIAKFEYLPKSKQKIEIDSMINYNKKYKFSIVIPTYNHFEDCLKPCLESLFATVDLDVVEIIVVANGCTDGTKPYLEANASRVKTIWMEKPAGYTVATNAGIKAANSDYVILLNNDVILYDIGVKNGWIDILHKPFLSGEKVGISGAAKNYHSGTDRDFLLFFCVMISKQLINEIGLLDECFNPGYGEDIDYCYRARNAGYKVLQVPKDVNYTKMRRYEDHTIEFPLYHPGSKTVHGVPNWEGIVARNENILMQKYSNKSNIKYSIIIPTYNHLNDCLKPCVESILQNTVLNDDIEIIIVANGCEDGTIEYTNTLPSQFVTIAVREQLGYVKACNLGMSKARGDYIILLNNDSFVLHQSWINMLHKPFANEAVGITGPLKSYHDITESEYLLFFCVMISRKVINSIGLLDENFGLGYHEDVDFCKRAIDAGFVLKQVPDDVAYNSKNKGSNSNSGNFPLFHKGGATFSGIFGESQKRLEKNTKYLFEKHVDCKITPSHIEACIAKAENNVSNINPEVLSIEGMSSIAWRHFLNNLCENKKIKYLECGSWLGSTACSILSNNKTVNAFMIENFSQFTESSILPPGVSHPLPKLRENLQKFANYNWHLYESDFFSFDFDRVWDIDVYLFDGPHGYDHHRNALPRALQCMNKYFVFMVDDYMWPSVRSGTNDSIEQLIRDKKIEKISDYVLDAEPAPKEFWPLGWIDFATNYTTRWRNGIYIGLFKKLV